MVSRRPKDRASVHLEIRLCAGVGIRYVRRIYLTVRLGENLEGTASEKDCSTSVWASLNDQ